VSPGKILIIIGGGILVIGLLVQAGLPLGRLPGDIRISRGSFTLYSPLMTGLLSQRRADHHPQPAAAALTRPGPFSGQT